MLTSVRAATVASLVVAAVATYVMTALPGPSRTVLAVPAAPADERHLRGEEPRTQGELWWLGEDVPDYDEVVNVEISAPRARATIQLKPPVDTVPEVGDEVMVLAKRRATVRNLASADTNRIGVDFSSSTGLPSVEPTNAPAEVTLALDSGGCRQLHPLQVWKVTGDAGTATEVTYDRSLVLIGPCVTD